MKSRVLNLFDYRGLDLSEYTRVFIPDEVKLDKELQKLLNRHSSWVKGDTVCTGDMVTLSLRSDIEKYNRDNLKLAVGSNLFNRYIEQEINGKRLGEELTLNVDGHSVRIKICEIMSRIRPAADDAFFSSLGIGCSSLKEYREELIYRQKEELLDSIGYDAGRFVIDSIFTNSEYVIDRSDFEYCVQLQLDRLGELARQEGKELQNMTEEDFMGRIPVKSYYELLNLIRTDTWEYILSYLTGRYIAERDNIAADTRKELYTAENQEYAEFWKCSVEEAERINTYEEFCIQKYQNIFYSAVRDFYTDIIIREKR